MITHKGASVLNNVSKVFFFCFFFTKRLMHTHSRVRAHTQTQTPDFLLHAYILPSQT